MTERQIKGCFGEVKKAYFPRWDRGGAWRVEFAGPELCRGATGYCDSRVKTVFLDTEACYIPKPGLRALLIHEICHDAGAAGHNLTWARRMERAAQRADARGERETAHILRGDIYSYCKLSVYQAATGREGLSRLPGWG